MQLLKEENGVSHDALQLALPPAKRSKKGKKKHQGQASAADYLKVTPLSREADLLREVWPAPASTCAGSSLACSLNIFAVGGQQILRTQADKPSADTEAMEHQWRVNESLRRHMQHSGNSRLVQGSGNHIKDVAFAGKCPHAAQQVREGAADHPER